MLQQVSDDSKKTAGRLFGLFRKKQEEQSISTPSVKNESSLKLLSMIYDLMLTREAQLQLDYEDDLREKRQGEEEQSRRHQEILKALTVKRKPEVKRRIKKEKKLEEKPSEPVTPGKPQTVAPAPSPAPAAPKVETKPTTPSAPTTPKVETKPPTAVPAPAPTTVTPTAQPTIPIPSLPKPVAATAVKAAAATGLSTAALTVIKAEQGVKSAEDALSPNNSEKRVQKGEFPDIKTPKVGAATPDTRNSTSYGLFGINNIRSVNKKTGETIVGSSSIDSLVKMFPNLGLPDPGDPTNPQQVKTFNDAWWKLAKENPQLLFNTQNEWFKKKFETPAVERLQQQKDKISENIINDKGVQLYLIDRRIQFGEALLQSAFDYAKNAKTPKEFIELISEHDKKNLRQIFKSTTDEQFQKIEKGLINRIDLRKSHALEKPKEPQTSNIISTTPNTGGQISTVSSENKEMKAAVVDESAAIKETTTNNVSVESPTQQSSVKRGKVDDRSAYEKLSRGQ